MKKQQGRFTPEYNTAIMKLIKNKFTPLQQKNKLYLPPMASKSCHMNNLNIHSLPSSPSHPLQSKKSYSQHYLLEKVHRFLDSKRNENHEFGQKAVLRQYIELFQKPVEIRSRDKRQSIELNIFQFSTKEKLELNFATSKIVEEHELNEEERSIMNAKIRMKLNHKKMIELSKKY